MAVHLHPLNDLKPHVVDDAWGECPCEPFVQYINPENGLPWEGDGPLIVHNSWDGRELFEELEA